VKLRHIPRPGPGLVVALIALFVVSGGSAMAASLITSKQIKDGTIQAKDISKKAKQALKGNTGLRGLSGALGPMGPQGPAGPQGVQGVQGAPGPVNLTYVRGDQVDVSATGQEHAEAYCPAGQSVVGGGVYSDSPNVGEMNVNSSYPIDDVDADAVPDDGWLAWVDVSTSDPSFSEFFQAYAICTTPTSYAKRGAAKVTKK
jgi:hypothetical protein